MKSNYLSIIFLLLCSFGFAQSYDVGGVVKESATGLPIAGVNILIKNTKTVAVTDTDGKFALKSVEAGSKIVFSFIGFKSFEYTVTATNNKVSIALKEDANSLEEVVVIGYGSQKVTKVSGAISTVKAVDIEKAKPVRVEEVLQGRTAGVSVVQNGSPASKPTVIIRGIPSYTGADPLVIVDGVPQTLDDFNAITSADIESINVLKDAAATAIYGVNGGNGVILVTTKSGKKNQKTEFNFNSYYGQQSVIRKVGVLNASEYAAIINEGSVVSGGNPIFTNLSTLGKGTNWQDEVFHNAAVKSQTLNARGGGEKVNYFLSAAYLGQEGIVGGGDKSNFDRINITTNFNIDLTPKLKLILNNSYVNIKNKSIQENGFNSILGSAVNFDPTVSVLNTVPNTVGKYGYSNLLLSEIFNPLTKLENTHNENNGNKFYGKAELQYDIIKNLKLTSRIGYTKYDEVGKRFDPLVFYGPLNVENTMNADGSTVTGKHNKVTEYTNSYLNWTAETFANYKFNYKEANHFELVAGISYSNGNGKHYTMSREDVRDNSWEWADFNSATGVNTTTNPTAITAGNWEDLTRKNASYFGRVLYDYEDKYLASFSGRRDGSFAFGKNNRFANFLAGSLGWVVSKESFFKSNVIDFLKIRTSYGTTGNEDVAPQYVTVIEGGIDGGYGETGNSNGYTFGNLGGGAVFVPGATVNTFENQNLRWEVSTQLSTGFDITLFKNLSINADYFSKKVDGLLFKDTSSLYGGTSLPIFANIGATKTTGAELTLGYNKTFSNDLKLNSALTYSTFKSTVTATNRDNTALIDGGYYFNGQSQSVTRFQAGYSPGYYYGYKTAGLFQTAAEVASSPDQNGALPGDIKFVDVNGDGIIDAKDRTQIGNPLPKFTMGWNLAFEYKNFDLTIFTYASVGNDVYRAYERNAQYTNKDRSVLARWTGEGTTNDAKNPRYTFLDTNQNLRVSDRYVEDGSFIKIKNVLLGYTIPASLYGKVFSKIKVYAQVKNLFTFTKYTGFDPEISGGILDAGVDRGSYPQARTISAGLDLKF
jgi:TonB-dependent starch-binding outer membrane protein SusC